LYDSFLLETAVFIPWGKSFAGDHIPYPAILYRQILARSQALSYPVEATTYDPFSLADIIPEKCDGLQNQQQCSSSSKQGGLVSSPLCGPLTEWEWAMRTVCCGKNTPMYCHNPMFVQHRMQDYYPSVSFYYSDIGDAKNLTMVDDSTDKVLKIDTREIWGPEAETLVQ